MFVQHKICGAQNGRIHLGLVCTEVIAASLCCAVRQHKVAAFTSDCCEFRRAAAQQWPQSPRIVVRCATAQNWPQSPRVVVRCASISIQWPQSPRIVIYCAVKKHKVAAITSDVCALRRSQHKMGAAAVSSDGAAAGGEAALCGPIAHSPKEMINLACHLFGSARD